ERDRAPDPPGAENGDCIHRLASPTAAARTTTLIDSPRRRLRLVRPRSETRLADGCGSYDHVHRLASPTAAARTTTLIDSPRRRPRPVRPRSETRLAAGRGSDDHLPAGSRPEHITSCPPLPHSLC